MMMRRTTAALLLCLYSTATTAFTPTHYHAKSTTVELNAKNKHNLSKFMASALVISTLASPPAMADEYGVETEAPTLFTGETVMVCSCLFVYRVISLCFLTIPSLLLLDLQKTRSIGSVFGTSTTNGRK